MTLVGITANVKYSGLAALADDTVYRPFRQQPWLAPFIVVRTAGDPAAFFSTLRREIAAVDPGIVTSSMATLDQLVATEAAPRRFRTLLLVAFSALGLVIAAVGVYGVVACTVAQRTKEIGIRMALGADGRRIVRMVLGSGMRMALAGTAIGAASALVVTRAMAALLYGIEATDVTSYAVASVTLMIIAAVATLVPAVRAASVDPIVTLRSE